MEMRTSPVSIICKGQSMRDSKRAAKGKQMEAAKGSKRQPVEIAKCSQGQTREDSKRQSVEVAQHCTLHL